MSTQHSFLFHWQLLIEDLPPGLLSFSSVPGGEDPKSWNQWKGMLGVPWLAVSLREWFARTRSTFISKRTSLLRVDRLIVRARGIILFLFGISCCQPFIVLFLRRLAGDPYQTRDYYATVCPSVPQHLFDGHWDRSWPSGRCNLDHGERHQAVIKS